MKEDILEQIGADWLLNKNGVFVKSNLKYKPNKEQSGYEHLKDNIPSDIDLLSVDLSDINTVKIINCKSWMDGFDFKYFHECLSSTEKHNRKFGGKEIWKHFRELICEKWHIAFINRIKEENPHVTQIEYYILCVHGRNIEYVKDWIVNPIIQNNFKKSGINLKSIYAKTIKDLIAEIETKSSETTENSDFCRTIQLLRAASIKLT